MTDYDPELKLLAAMFAEQEHLAEALRSLQSWHFITIEANAVFSQLEARYREGKGVDPEMVLPLLESKSPPLASILHRVVFYNSAVPDYIAEIKKRGKYHKFKTSCQEALLNLDESKPDKTINKHLDDIINLSIENSDENRIVSLKEIFEDWHLDYGSSYEDDIHSKVNNIKNNFEINYPWKQLNDMLEGIRRKNFTVIGGAPGMGKTMLACNIAYHLAREKKRLVILSLEMSKKEMLLRLLSLASSVPSKKISSGGLSKEEYERLLVAKPKMAETETYITSNPEISVHHLRRIIKAEVVKGCDVIMVDYLGLLKSSVKFNNRWEMIGEVSRSLKCLSKEMNIPIIALAQVNRESSKRQEKRPQLSDLRESGQIEADADVVMFVHRPDYYLQENKHAVKEVLEIVVAKNRHGPTGTVKLDYDKLCGRIYEKGTISFDEEQKEAHAAWDTFKR